MAKTMLTAILSSVGNDETLTSIKFTLGSQFFMATSTCALIFSAVITSFMSNRDLVTFDPM